MAPTLRLLADDLTGALDTAAEFVGLVGPVHAFWQGARPGILPINAAIDTGTRETDEATARAVVSEASAALAGATLAYKKVDSLIRGQTLPELAACYVTGAWQHAVLAPAFPFQGRVTRQGQQFVAAGGGWTPVGPLLVDALRALGLPANAGTPGTPLTPGITVFDAETDADLDAVVAAVESDANVLWCGTGGLARALAGGHTQPAHPSLPGPVLGLFGSDQSVTAAQLAACGVHWTALPHGGPASGAYLAEQLRRHGIALASLDLPTGLSRAAAALRIGRELHALTTHLPRPGTLVVAGGETLRGLCIALGAESLVVQGRAVPGVPVSCINGGAWDGVTVVSKSGAFGHPTLLRELLRLPDPERTAS
ncbi:four-carbon acid sugar kinase family protein [Acidisphaera sp. L21]|uniref:four-carbon acid sugar kinase family protein n=1 Tax=Acidisphaera sp. L21 TaxID=1641851 RepID=UPI00131A6EE7|nr:four-carbon acid sugar kinase family protein [Acidisphaera sp. L21]